MFLGASRATMSRKADPVASAELVPYGYDATYDVLPASSTGTYFVAGALIGSTLFVPGLESLHERIELTASRSIP
jgi:hypothetical protein